MSEFDLNEPETQHESIIQQEPVTPASLPSVRLPGAELAVRRQQLGLTVEHMAGRLKLTQRQILALEADNYTVLPGMAIVRGFVRAYAKALDIDPVPLVAMIQEEKAPALQNLAPTWRGGVSTPYTETRLPTLGRADASPQFWLVSVSLAILLIGALLVARYMEWLPNMSRIELLQSDKAQSSPPPVLIVKEAESVSATGAVGSEMGTLVQKELPPIAPEQVLPATEEHAAGEPVNAVAAVDQANPAQPASPVNALVLKAREQSWYEIRRANGTVVRSGLLHAGATETFEIAEPVQLTLGNAPGVDATLRGAPLEIRSEEGSKVVKLNVK